MAPDALYARIYLLMFLSGLEIDFHRLRKERKSGSCRTERKRLIRFFAASIILPVFLFYHSLLSYGFVLAGFIKMLFNDAYYFNDFFGRCRSNVERRTDHEFKYRADYFARCCYCGFGHDDSSCCFFFFIRRGQRKHVAPDDPIRAGVVLYFSAGSLNIALLFRPCQRTIRSERVPFYVNYRTRCPV